jgi:very-short-patch-repair endonuclease
MKLTYKRKLVPLARDLRKQSTLAEILLWNQIKNKQLGYIFNRQQVIGGYIVDFICRKENAVIEIDGDSHDGKKEYDNQRDEYLKSQDLIVIHIHDLEVKTNMQGVLGHIKKCIETRESSSIITKY